MTTAINPTRIADLPFEILSQIATYGVLDVEDVVVLSSCNRYLHECLSDQYIWFKLAQRLLPLPFKHLSLSEASLEVNRLREDPSRQVQSWRGLLTRFELMERQFGSTLTGKPYPLNGPAARRRLTTGSISPVEPGSPCEQWYTTTEISFETPIATISPSLKVISAYDVISPDDVSSRDELISHSVEVDQQAGLLITLPDWHEDGPAVTLVDCHDYSSLWSCSLEDGRRLYGPTKVGASGKWMVLATCKEEVDVEQQNGVVLDVFHSTYDPKIPASRRGFEWVQQIDCTSFLNLEAEIDDLLFCVQGNHLLIMDQAHHTLRLYSPDKGQEERSYDLKALLSSKTKDPSFMDTIQSDISALAADNELAFLICNCGEELVALDLISDRPSWSLNSMEYEEYDNLKGKTLRLQLADRNEQERPDVQSISCHFDFPSIDGEWMQTLSVCPSTETLVIGTCLRPNPEDSDDPDESEELIPHGRICIIKHYKEVVWNTGAPAWFTLVEMSPDYCTNSFLIPSTVAHRLCRAFVPIMVIRRGYDEKSDDYLALPNKERLPLSAANGVDKIVPMLIDWSRAERPDGVRFTILQGELSPPSLAKQLDPELVNGLVPHSPALQILIGTLLTSTQARLDLDLDSDSALMVQWDWAEMVEKWIDSYE